MFQHLLLFDLVQVDALAARQLVRIQAALLEGGHGGARFLAPQCKKMALMDPGEYVSILL